MQPAPGRAQRRLTDLFESVGLVVDGPDPWDPQIRDPRFFRRVLHGGSLGLGESYVDGWWDVERLDVFIERLLRIDVRKWNRASPGLALRQLLRYLRSRLTNPQRIGRARTNVAHHYDIGNELYEAMLDSRLVYTSGYWRRADDLERSQEEKLELVCEKLRLSPGMRVLDIGCGWGSLGRWAARRHDVEVVGITLSERQLELGRRRTEGLPVELRLQDYRELEEADDFDRVVSLGMFEHVGPKNYRRFMEVARAVLREDGLFLLDSIGSDRSTRMTEPWLDRYVFPDSTIPSAGQVTGATEGLFVLEDWHNFGVDYDRTLMAWHANLVESWDDLPARYDERFRRLWEYYLLSCAGAFRARRVQQWQLVLSPRGVAGGYRAPR